MLSRFVSVIVDPPLEINAIEGQGLMIKGTVCGQDKPASAFLGEKESFIDLQK